MAVFFVMAGTGLEMHVAMIAFGVLPVMAQSVYLAARDVPDELLFKAYTLGASDDEVILEVILPFVMPKLLDTLRLQIGPAMVYLIAAEMLVGDVGFGYRIRLQQRLLNMSLVYPYLVILAAFGFLGDALLTRIRRFACPWTED
jgi:NitT/TauT family transport system permease protein